MMVRLLVLGCVFGVGAAQASAQISFRQGSAGLALPPFGGYTPGAGATIGFSTRGGMSVNPGNSAALAVPPFGGYAPGAGATLRNSSPRGLSFRQGSFPLAIPPFGGFVPGAGATISSRNAGPRAPMGMAVQANGRNAPAAARQNAANSVQTYAANSYARKGDQAAAAGKSGVAQMYYRMALKRATGNLKSQLEAKLEKPESATKR